MRQVSPFTLCREWRQTHLKAAFEVSMLDENDDDGLARVTDLAAATKGEIEAALIDGARSVETVDDAQAILGVAIAILRDDEQGFDPDRRALALIRAAHGSMNSIRNATTQPRAA